jgi:prepilin-type N-terminal cleavage/methylation domain-containing protein
MHTAHAHCVRRPRSSRNGFTIIELVLAMFLITVGLVGTAALMATSQRYQRASAAREEMATLAERKLEELRLYQSAPTASGLKAKLAVGGSLTSSVTNYADSMPGASGKAYRLRWEITNALAGTREVVVQVQPKYTDSFVVSSVQFRSLVYLH